MGTFLIRLWCHLIRFLPDQIKNVPDFQQTHNYTGESGPINSPQAPACLFVGFSGAHRGLRERGIIAAKPGPSTSFFMFFDGGRNPLPAGPPGGRAARRKGRFFGGIVAL